MADLSMNRTKLIYNCSDTKSKQTINFLSVYLHLPQQPSTNDGMKHIIKRVGQNENID